MAVLIVSVAGAICLIVLIGRRRNRRGSGSEASGGGDYVSGDVAGASHGDHGASTGGGCWSWFSISH